MTWLESSLRERMVSVNDTKSKLDKDDSRRIRVQIRHVLLDVWDPIGIKNEPNAQDEYDGYIGKLYDMLQSKAIESELTEYLYWAAHDNMGFDAASRSDMAATVEALKKILLDSSL
jgi:hypothetical protein